MRRWNANPRGRRTIAVGLPVLLLHALWAWLLGGDTLRHAPAAVAPTRVTLRLVPMTPMAPPMVKPPTPAPTRVAGPPVPASPATRAKAPARAPIATTAPPAAPPTTPPTDPPTATAAITPPAPAASDTVATTPLLDTDATRRAIRSSARSPWLGDQLARSREEPARAGPNERLATGVREAGKGDCLKGEYAGAGMGLLSVPFLALAAARGACAR